MTNKQQILYYIEQCLNYLKTPEFHLFSPQLEECFKTINELKTYVNQLNDDFIIVKKDNFRKWVFDNTVVKEKGNLLEWDYHRKLQQQIDNKAAIYSNLHYDPKNFIADIIQDEFTKIDEIK